MTLPQIIIFSIIGGTLILFVWGKWRYDVVAIIALLATVLCGLVDSKDAFSGFGHPATITVAAVLILSHTLSKSGAIEGLARFISPLTFSTTLHIGALSIIAAALSMFMNNVGALAVLMPFAIQSAIKANRHPALLLMPISFASILGGLVTLIGTPPNIIIATYREKALGEPFSMFDFSPVGGVVAITGIIFISIIGWRFVKIRGKGQKGSYEAFQIESYFSEIKIPKGSEIIGKLPNEVSELINDPDISIVSLIRKKQRYYVIPKTQPFAAGDTLMVEGGHDSIDKLVTRFKLKLVTSSGGVPKLLHSAETDTQEIVVLPNSEIEGKTASQVKFRRKYGINLLGVSRHGTPYRGRLKSFRFQVGDVLLIHGEKENLSDSIPLLDCLPLAERIVDFGRRRFAFLALGIFVMAITVSAIGLLSLQISLGVAIIAMLLLNVLPVKELYSGIDWSVIVLLGAMIPVGGALESTGATELLAHSLLNIASGVSLALVLALLLIITMTLSDVLNNAATAILMAPIGKALAQLTGTNPDTFLMAVAIGASCAFLTPIGHQNNAIIMGPGGYKFGDYWRMGLPLEILIVLVSVPMILWVWPL